MLHLKNTTGVNPVVVVPVAARLHAKSSMHVASVPKAESDQKGVSVLARVGQCGGAVALAAMLVRYQANTRLK